MKKADNSLIKISISIDLNWRLVLVAAIVLAAAFICCPELLPDIVRAIIQAATSG